MDCHCFGKAGLLPFSEIIHYPMEELGMSFNGENLFFFFIFKLFFLPSFINLILDYFYAIHLPLIAT